MYYNICEALTHNKLINFVVSARGLGKTYSAKEWAIRDFLKNGSQFIYVRRFKEELKKPRKSFFDDIIEKFPDVTFKIDGDTIKIDGEVAGNFLSLSTAKIQKSTPFPKVNKIIFDEFIIDSGYYHYLPDEVTNFLEMYWTIARDRDCRVFFLSNAITITNPYFMYFNIKINNLEKRFHHFGDILVDLPRDLEHEEKMFNTRMGKIIKGTSYADYAITNKFLRDDDTFVEKKTGKARHYFTFKYKDKLYYIWVDWSEGKYFVSKDKDPYQELVFCLTQSDHSPNTMLLKGRKDRMLSEFVENYKLGNVYFEDINIKNIFFEIIKLFLL
jgi:hypothetical protein